MNWRVAELVGAGSKWLERPPVTSEAGELGGGVSGGWGVRLPKRRQGREAAGFLRLDALRSCAPPGPHPRPRVEGGGGR